MEIEVEQSRLAKALAVVSRVAAGARATLPVLNNVLIRVDGKKVTLTTTNLDMAVVDYLPTSKSKNGAITVPARLLAEFVSNLPRGEIVKIKVEGEKVRITSGRYSSVMNGTPADDFPDLPDLDEKKVVKYQIGVDEFKLGLSQVIFAASSDTTRPALTGIFFNTFEKALYIVGTDGYRLTKRTFIDKVTSEVAAIVPAASLQEVLRSIGEDVEEIEILFDETQVRFRFGEIEITSKLIDTTYPDYQDLIPDEVTISLELDRAELLRTAKLAAIFSRNNGGSIVYETRKEDGIFSVHAVVNELGENDSQLKVDGVTEDIRAVVNSRYVMDALNALNGEKVNFSYTNSGLKPIILRDVDDPKYVEIIMPLNI